VALALIQKATGEEMPDFDQQALNEALTRLDGDPVAIYERLPPLEEAPQAVMNQASPAGYHRGS
jgi:L,D-transpeptidase ErfK/SrfK